MSRGEETLALHLQADRITGWVREYRFAAEAVGGTGKGVRGRLERSGLSDYRFDFAWPEQKIAVEVDGGTWRKGAHSSGAGIARDRMKDESALRLGWTVYRCTTEMVLWGRAVETIAILLAQREAA